MGATPLLSCDVFHAEHNRLMEHTKAVVLATNDPAYIAEWLVPGAQL